MIHVSRIDDILAECLQGADTEAEIIDIPEDCRIVQGVMHSFAINSTKIEPFRPEIIDMLRQLDNSFMDDGGQGMSLMNMVATKDDRQWGEQIHADRLYVLANALDLAKYTLPREMWRVLPGSMPYITIMRSQFDAN